MDFFVGISFGNMHAHVFDTKCMEKEKNGLDFCFTMQQFLIRHLIFSHLTFSLINFSS